ncbi:CLUMA_CG010593, isoform A [Clunio marinus]|uniref:CLUMA_CG010593, isoform A n=1 Tax=Clunio marinus TaxID=568069 RepID=A0A1J1ICB8_9DIPT|nr:CLUMA_CG010593, isoform A [Clunio marinus]
MQPTLMSLLHPIFRCYLIIPFTRMMCQRRNALAQQRHCMFQQQLYLSGVLKVREERKVVLNLCLEETITRIASKSLRYYLNILYCRLSIFNFRPLQIALVFVLTETRWHLSTFCSQHSTTFKVISKKLTAGKKIFKR